MNQANSNENLDLLSKIQNKIQSLPPATPSESLLKDNFTNFVDESVQDKINEVEKLRNKDSPSGLVLRAEDIEKLTDDIAQELRRQN